MDFITINLAAIRKSVSKFFKDDKKDGVKKAWYYTHIDLRTNMALDTKAQYEETVKFYEAQGIMYVKTIDKDIDAKKLGAEGCKLHVFRKEGATLQRCLNKKGLFAVDEIACSLGYMPADCEFTIAEVFFTKK
jgi:hypothetical protein